ncbi:MAG: hypothetical protein IJY65_01685 [Clostridia bacterium]|nr:hypothetical protein [Clostridia bacterium]
MKRKYGALRTLFAVLLCTLLSAVLFATASITSLAATDAERAAAFVEAVEAISDAATLADKKAAADYANSAAVKFTDTSYTGVADALAELDEQISTINKAIEDSESFVEQVSVAISEYYAGGSYLVVRAALDAAQDSYYSSDPTWQGVLSARESYTTINAELLTGETASRSYIQYANECQAALDEGGDIYSEISTSYKNAKNFDKTLIAEYPGVSEATEILLDAEEYMQSAEATANEFIAAVSTVGVGNPYEKIPAAYAVLERTDKSVKGVSSAIRSLEGRVAAINAIAERANAAQKELVGVAALGASGKIDTAAVAFLPLKKEI